MAQKNASAESAIHVRDQFVWGRKSIDRIEARLQRLVMGARSEILGRCPRLEREAAPLALKRYSFGVGCPDGYATKQA